jgi:signal peptide peptidase SppA
MYNPEMEIALLRGQPLAIEPHAMNCLEASVASHSSRAAVRPAAGIRRPAAGNIAALSLSGVLCQRPNILSMLGFATSTQMFAGELRMALSDSTIHSILIDIDSPGGSVYGTGELADLIYQARSVKHVVGVVSSLCASAAYWIGSNCSQLYCTPGGEVGSIGVFVEHRDISAQIEADGIKVTLMSAGRYKVEGNCFRALDTEAKAAIQASVDGYYSMFTKAVARGRGVPIAAVRSGMGQGRCLGPRDAQMQNMIDGVDTVEGVMRRMRTMTRGAATAASAAITRARFQLTAAGYRSQVSPAAGERKR